MLKLRNIRLFGGEKIVNTLDRFSMINNLNGLAFISEYDRL
jgi:hypothetical protein